MIRLFAALALALLMVPGTADAKIKLNRDFRFSRDTPVRIVVFRPDVKVGTLGAGSVEEANADWTRDARARLTAQLEANRKGSGQEVIFLPDQQGDKAQLVADYQALFRTVAAAVVSHAMTPGASLPAKKDRFDWTLGAGAARLATIGGGDYALFLSTRDAYGTAGRKTMQIFAALMFGAAIQAGIHQSYAALVDLKTGNLVWMNFDPGSGGDVRTHEGATKRIGQLMTEFPLVEGAAPTPATAPAKVAAK